MKRWRRKGYENIHAQENIGMKTNHRYATASKDGNDRYERNDLSKKIRPKNI